MDLSGIDPALLLQAIQAYLAQQGRVKTIQQDQELEKQRQLDEGGLMPIPESMRPRFEFASLAKAGPRRT